MTEVKGVTWDFEGEQLTLGWALALCYHAGWHRRKYLIQAVTLMTSESQRWTRAYHHNHEHDEAGENVHDNEFGNIITLSTDWGLFQINDKWHPTFELPEGLNPIYNAEYAHEMWKASGGFSPWAAYGGDRYFAYYPLVAAAHLLGRWKNKLPNVEKKFA